MSATKEYNHKAIEEGIRQMGAADSNLLTNRGSESAKPEHPILFGTPMVQGILARKKWKTWLLKSWQKQLRKFAGWSEV